MSQIFPWRQDVSLKIYAMLENGSTTYQDILNSGLSYQMILDPQATDAEIAVQEDYEAISEELTIAEYGIIGHTEQDSLVVGEDHIPFINRFEVIFNDDPRAPGFTIFLEGLLEQDQFQLIDVFRRDPSGRYKDQRVRGLADVLIQENNITITDYEAPLNTELHYYLRLYQTDGEGNFESGFDYGPIHPQPQPFIPTQAAYGGGVAYLKIIDVPDLSRPILVESMDEWHRPANVLAEHRVLGRRNKVVITDVLGGREGSMSAHCFLDLGQSYEEIDFALSPGATVLFQNINPSRSAFPDFYAKITDVSFTRHNKVGYKGNLETVNNTVQLVTFELNYIEVDRPDPRGVVIPVVNWGTVNDTFLNFMHVMDTRENWLDLLIRPFGLIPGEGGGPSEPDEPTYGNGLYGEGVYGE